MINPVMMIFLTWNGIVQDRQPVTIKINQSDTRRKPIMLGQSCFSRASGSPQLFPYRLVVTLYCRCSLFGFTPLSWNALWFWILALNGETNVCNLSFSVQGHVQKFQAPGMVGSISVVEFWLLTLCTLPYWYRSVMVINVVAGTV